jgi:predicted nucleic acid-binding Zn ribbon protein
MAEDKVSPAEKREDQHERSILERSRFQLRLMRILFAVFCILLLLALVLSLILNSDI